MDEATEANLAKLSPIKIIAVVAALILTVFLGRAVLAYYGNTSICFNPLRTISERDHINAAVSYLQSQSNLDWEMRYGGGKTNVEYLKSLNPKTCCKVYGRGRWASESFNKITFYSTLTGRHNRIVDAGQKPILKSYTRGTYANYDFSRMPHYEKRFRVPTTVCGTNSPEYY